MMSVMGMFRQPSLATMVRRAWWLNILMCLTKMPPVGIGGWSVPIAISAMS